MATVLTHFRGRNDNGNETTATWKAAEDTNWTQLVDVNFRVRFKVQNSVSAINNLDVQVQYALNGGGFNDVSASSSVVRASASPNLTDQSNLTVQLTAGTGTFIGANCFDEVNGICGGNSLDVTATGNFETEFCVQIRGVDVVHGDSIQLRTINNDSGAAWTTYDVTPTITVSEPSNQNTTPSSVTATWSTVAPSLFSGGVALTPTALAATWGIVDPNVEIEQPSTLITDANTLGAFALKPGSIPIITMNLDQAVEANCLVVVVVSKDNESLSDVETNEVLSVTDSVHNTYIKVKEFCNSESIQAAGAIVAIFYSRVVTAIPADGTISATFSITPAASCISAHKFTVEEGKSIQVVSTDTLADDGQDPGSMSFAGLTSSEYLFFRGIGSETGSVTPLTPTADYTAIEGAQTS